MEPQATTTSPPAPALRARLRLARGAGLARRLPTAFLLALPGGLTAYTGFNAGGFFAGTQGLLAAVLALVLVLWILFADDPLAGASVWLVVAVGALAALTVWTLVSAGWSNAPGRAVLEFDRTFFYLLALLLFGLLPMTPERLRWMVRGVALATLAICVAALLSRLLPHVLPTTPNVVNRRLSYPVTYWNALGLVAALGLLQLVHLTSSEREPWAVRVLAAAAAPVVATALYLTLSRGAIGAAALGLLVYLLVGRPRLLAPGLLAVATGCGVAVVAAYRADALVSSEPTTPRAVEQGADLAALLVLCVVGAAALRALLLAVDRRITRRAPVVVPVGLKLAVAAGVVAATVAVFLALGGPTFVSRQYQVFARGRVIDDRANLRGRLTEASSNGRTDLWRVAVRAWRQQRLQGHGAGTFQVVWNQERPYAMQAFDGHSLYLETLAELGVVGLVLLMAALLTTVVGVARRCRGPDRALFAVVLAAAAAWALRAAADWDWEMPVVTAWLFCLGGASLAVPLRGERVKGAGRRGGGALRLLAAIGVLVVAITPVRVALSQRHLDRAVRAYDRDCPRTIDQSLSSVEALGSRPEPYMLVSFCDVRLNRPDLALRAATTATELDPQAWQYHYALALVRGVAGRDPLPEARLARRLNPRERLAIDAERLFSTRDPRQWRERALDAPLPEG